MSATLPQIDAATFALLNADAQQALLAGIRLLDNTLNAELIAAAATMTVGTYDAITMFPRELKHIYSNYTSWVSILISDSTYMGDVCMVSWMANGPMRRD
ncbi:hypothetical protein EMMF5_003743 [Cystobasidiomycetes sp. EMM_F5]